MTQHGITQYELVSSLNRDQLDMLCHGMRGHSDGGIHPDVTIQTCWDADRFDPGRVGTKPNARYLFLRGVKHIDEAYAWRISTSA